MTEEKDGWEMKENDAWEKGSSVSPLFDRWMKQDTVAISVRRGERMGLTDLRMRISG